MVCALFQRLHQILPFCDTLRWWLCPFQLMFLCICLKYLTSYSPHQIATELVQWSPELCLSIGWALNSLLCLVGWATILTKPTTPFINSPMANILLTFSTTPGSIEHCRHDRNPSAVLTEKTLCFRRWVCTDSLKPSFSKSQEKTVTSSNVLLQLLVSAHMDIYLTFSHLTSTAHLLSTALPNPVTNSFHICTTL